MGVTRVLAAGRVLAALSALAALAAVAGVAACGRQDPAAGAVSVSACHKQFEAWQHGRAAAPLAALSSDTAALTRAGTTENINAALTWLKAAGLAAASVERTREPRCADPAGFYRRYLAILVQGGRDTAHGLNGLIDDEAKLESLRGINAELRAELDRTVGKAR